MKLQRRVRKQSLEKPLNLSEQQKQPAIWKKNLVFLIVKYLVIADIALAVVVLLFAF